MDQEIHLQKAPLIEAWLELQWKLTEGDIPQIVVDEKFPFALGAFRTAVKKEYPVAIDLTKGIDAPFRQLKYRFLTEEKHNWPLVQIGPGIASVNTSSEGYRWELFKGMIRKFLKQVYEAYDHDLKPTMMVLRYRNIFEADFVQPDFFQTIQKLMNIYYQNPSNIPGAHAEISNPIEFIFGNSFYMSQPKGKARYTITNGSKGEGREPVIVMELEFLSINDDVPELQEETALDEWLEQSHEILHSWFFSFIAGELFQQYQES